MTIDLIVEDGQNVVDANSYVDVVDARAYASNRGIELPEDNDELAAMLIQAMDYIESKESEFQGSRTFDTQELSWPRIDVYLNRRLISEFSIPKQLIGAQVQLAIAISKGIDIMPTVLATDYIIEDTVGPITTKFADPTKIGNGDMSPSMTAVAALLAPLIGSYNPCCPIGLRTVRV